MLEMGFSFQEGMAVGLFVAIMVFESLFPFRKQLGRWRHFGKNALFAAINSGVTGLATAAAWKRHIIVIQSQGDVLLVVVFAVGPASVSATTAI